MLWVITFSRLRPCDPSGWLIVAPTFSAYTPRLRQRWQSPMAPRTSMARTAPGPRLTRRIAVKFASYCRSPSSTSFGGIAGGEGKSPACSTTTSKRKLVEGGKRGGSARSKLSSKPRLQTLSPRKASALVLGGGCLLAIAQFQVVWHRGGRRQDIHT